MGNGGSTITVRKDTSLNISSFGESESGELYVTDLNGSLYRVIAPEFRDIATSTFLDSIHWILYEGLTVGCGSGRFCPTAAGHARADGDLPRSRLRSSLDHHRLFHRR